jgi:CBS domain-containing protein
VAFRTPLTLFGGLKEGEQGLDLKKGGIFPVVHGVRALALRHGIAPTNTYARIEALVAADKLHADTGRDLAQALSVLIRLRLGEQLAALGRGEAAGNALKVDQLRRLDLDLLRDALRVVRDFQGQLRREFGLG